MAGGRAAWYRGVRSMAASETALLPAAGAVKQRVWCISTVGCVKMQNPPMPWPAAGTDALATGLAVGTQYPKAKSLGRAYKLEFNITECCGTLGLDFFRCAHLQQNSFLFVIAFTATWRWHCTIMPGLAAPL
jgi:hypothetical protein